MTFVVFTPRVYSQDTQELTLPEQGDVRIIVDISGSMKANDPDNLRQPAVRLLARMLPEGAEAGVWTFGQWVNMLVPHGTVDDTWRASAVAKSREINSVALRTNLGEAMVKASDDYLGGDDLSNTDFILLTDGMVDLADDPAINARERERILGPLLDELKRRGATLHTVALSEEADLEMLEALAAESGGHYSLTSSADGLNRAFLKALNAAVPQEQIPLDEEGFTVDSGVEEFTALIFWGEGETSATRSLEMVNPAGKRATESSVAGNMRWAAETGYDLVTVSEPAAGQWQVNGELGEGSRVTVVSDLRMVVSPVPPSFTSDEPISLKVAFYEEDSRIQNPDFLNVIDVIVRVTSSDGRSGSKILNQGQPPENGVYVDQIPSLPAAGNYDIEVVADGSTFSRRFSGVTRFVLPESSLPAEAVPAETAADEPVTAEPTTVSSIDISNLEEPPVNEAPVAEPKSVSEGTPLWVWALAGGVGLLVVVGGGWLWLRRKSSDTEASGQNPVPEVVEEPEPEPENDGLPPVIEPDAEEDVPEPEPEPEPEPDENVPELEPELESEPEADDEDEDEFGLDDFDLSEFDDLPENGESEPGEDDSDDEKGPKKGE
jgi:outer membrane biosynthesis protein TonB